MATRSIHTGQRLEEQGAEEIQKLKSLVIEQSERAKRYDIHKSLSTSPPPVPLDPRASALFQEATDLVGIDGPHKEIIELLNCEEKQHKVVNIYGTAGQGKTTLAMEVYLKITEAFDYRAFASVSQTPDIKKLLRDLLSQLSNKQLDDQTERWEMEQLIRNIRDYLIDKRYLILIDDVWSVEAWEHIQSALPRNDNGLINRSLVQPVKVGADGVTVKECRVHDVILGFIVSKAVEDNFVTIWNHNGFSERMCQYLMAQECSRRPSGHPILEAP